MANTDFNTIYSGSGTVNRSGALTAHEKRGAYVIVAGEDPTALTPGNVNVLVYGGVLFNYDSTDALTAHDGTTCIVTADGKRFKTDQFEGANSKIVPVLDQNLATPPGSPTIGDTYIVAASGTGAWATKDEQFASYTARGWVFIVPNAWDIAYVEDEALFYHYNDSGVWTSGLPALTIADTSISLKKLKYFPLGVSVENQTTNTPPGSPADGVAYIVGGSPTGAWVGHELDLAIYETSAWVFYDGYEGARVYDKALNALYTHNGATWATPAANTWLFIEEKTASASATLDFTNLSGYRALRFTIINVIPATDGVTLNARVSSDNGSTFIATNTYSQNFGSGGNSSLAHFRLNENAVGIGNAAGDGGIGGKLEIFDFNVAQKTKALACTVAGDTGGLMIFQDMYGFQTAQTAMNAFRFLMSSGNITSGKILLEGMV